jgi:hypothetical protein
MNLRILAFNGELIKSESILKNVSLAYPAYYINNNLYIPLDIKIDDKYHYGILEIPIMDDILSSPSLYLIEGNLLGSKFNPFIATRDKLYTVMSNYNDDIYNKNIILSIDIKNNKLAEINGVNNETILNFAYYNNNLILISDMREDKNTIKSSSNHMEISAYALGVASQSIGDLYIKEDNNYNLICPSVYKNIDIFKNKLYFITYEKILCSYNLHNRKINKVYNIKNYEGYYLFKVIKDNFVLFYTIYYYDVNTYILNTTNDEIYNINIKNIIDIKIINDYKLIILTINGIYLYNMKNNNYKKIIQYNINTNPIYINDNTIYLINHYKGEIIKIYKEKINY